MNPLKESKLNNPEIREVIARKLESHEADLTETSFDHDCDVRLATLDDVDLIHSWYENGMGVKHSAVDLEGFKVDFLEMFANENQQIRIIRENGVDVGWVLEEESTLPYEIEVLGVFDEGQNDMSLEEMLGLFKNNEPIITWLNINVIEILADARGKGVGKKVMETLLSEYEKNGVSLLTFHTQMKNLPMIHIAKEFGFALLHVPDVKGEDGKPVQDDGRIFAIKVF